MPHFWTRKIVTNAIFPDTLKITLDSHWSRFRILGPNKLLSVKTAKVDRYFFLNQAEWNDKVVNNNDQMDNRRMLIKNPSKTFRAIVTILVKGFRNSDDRTTILEKSEISEI